MVRSSLSRARKPTRQYERRKKLLIRHFVEEGHELFNIQGVKLRVQTLRNDRPPVLNKVIPLRTQVEA